MKVLIVGSGGREHAIAASAAKSKQVDEIYCAPGNAGIAGLATCVDIGAMEFDKLADFAEEKEIVSMPCGIPTPHDVLNKKLILPLSVWTIHWLAVSWMYLKNAVCVSLDREKMQRSSREARHFPKI